MCYLLVILVFGFEFVGVAWVAGLVAWGCWLGVGVCFSVCLVVVIRVVWFACFTYFV